MQKDRLYVTLGESAPRPLSIASFPWSFVYSQSGKWTGPQFEFSLVQQAVHSVSSLSVNQHTEKVKVFENGPPKKENIP